MSWLDVANDIHVEISSGDYEKVAPELVRLIKALAVYHCSPDSLQCARYEDTVAIEKVRVSVETFIDEDGGGSGGIWVLLSYTKEGERIPTLEEYRELLGPMEKLCWSHGDRYSFDYFLFDDLDLVEEYSSEAPCPKCLKEKKERTVRQRELEALGRKVAEGTDTEEEWERYCQLLTL